VTLVKPGQCRGLTGLALLFAASSAVMDLGCNAEPQSPADVNPGLVGLQAPLIDADPLGGEGPTSLEQARGQVVIVDFFATFCDPCAASFPRYQRLLDQHPGELAVFAVAVDNPASVERDEILSFVHQHPVDFPLFWDVTTTTTRAYAPPGYPASYVIDREGIVRHVFGGYRASKVDGIEKAVKKLLE